MYRACAETSIGKFIRIEKIRARQRMLNVTYLAMMTPASAYSLSSTYAGMVTLMSVLVLSVKRNHVIQACNKHVTKHTVTTALQQPTGNEII